MSHGKGPFIFFLGGGVYNIRHPFSFQQNSNEEKLQCSHSNRLQFGNAPSIAGDKTTGPRRIAATASSVAKLVGEKRGRLHVEAEKMPPIRHQARTEDQSRQERRRTIRPPLS